MHVEQVFVNGHLYERNNLHDVKKEEAVQLLMDAFALNNDAVTDGDKNIKGDSTEVACWNCKGTGCETGLAPVGGNRFDADRKLMTTFHNYGTKIISFTKGAPRIFC